MSHRLFYTDHYEISLPPGHRFPMKKYRMLRELLARDGHFEFVAAPLARAEVVEMAHDPAYVRDFLEGNLSAEAIRRIGFPWSEGLVKRTLGSVGGTLSAAVDALDTGWGGSLAGGTHHAFRSEGSGYCVFNDLAVAIRWLQSTGRIRTAAVVDLDVHQGDGTAQIFGEDPTVLTLSLHCEINFPFRKQQSRIDVALPQGCGDDGYMNALTNILPEVGRFNPDIVFYQSGVDVLATDSLGHLNLSPEGLKSRDRLTMETFREKPFVVTIGGGYSKPIGLTVEAHANTYRMAAEVFDGIDRRH